MKSVTLRPGQPSYAAEASPLIYDSSHELMEFLFGGRDVAEGVVARLFAKSVGHFSFRFSTTALVSDRIVGLELGYDRDQLSRHTLLGSLLMLLSSPLSRWRHLITKAGRIIDGYVPKPSAGAYYINNLAVSTALRGSGIGAQLLTNAIERARRNSYVTVELDLTSVNARAIAFYRKHGFLAVSQSGTEDLQETFGLPPLVRMVKPTA